MTNIDNNTKLAHVRTAYENITEAYASKVTVFSVLSSPNPTLTYEMRLLLCVSARVFHCLGRDMLR